ncbi:unnamed protein product [Onchocerca flexuosa]|uniref:HIG1 domain-containing protein n=1 Tax=Onchocerca flexuosa TaxID=387005 RepID=A0A183HAJ8_9BILA|nr:unnamed protein product [Onchocerca flexuosa]
MKRRRDWLKNPVFLSGTLLAWIALMRYLKPHSERVSFAEHRFRLFLQASSFVFVLTCATAARYYQQMKTVLRAVPFPRSMIIGVLRKVYMANISVSSSDADTAASTIDYKMLKRRHDWLKNPYVLAGIILPWIALNGFLKPHSERVSFAQHRFRIFLQFCTFVTVLSVATMMRKYKSRG